MRSHILLLTSLCCFAAANNTCNQRTVTTYFKKPLYVFSTEILDRVAQETGGNFVFSPISSWFQLVNIAEGAKGRTLYELWKATGGHRMPCIRRLLRMMLNRVNKQMKIKSQSLVIVDKLLKVKKMFKKKLELSETVKVASLDFDKPDASADRANRILAEATEGDIVDVIDPSDFNLTTLLMSDAMSFTNAWKKPFNPSYTNLETFYHGRIPHGQVQMMSQIGYFNYQKLDIINAEVLELPCIDDNHSMLIFLPTKGNISDLYYYLKRIRLATIFNLFKKDGDKLVNVKLPRFEIMTEVENLPELLHDMGVKRIFDPFLAELKGISDYWINVSGMKQNTYIRVTEEGVSAMADSIIFDDASPIDFIANRPFAFMLINKPTEIPLFAGIYLEPTVY